MSLTHRPTPPLPTPPSNASMSLSNAPTSLSNNSTSLSNATTSVAPLRPWTLPPNTLFGVFRSSDPHRVLVDLVAALRSPSTAEQAQAISLFPVWFHRQPLPPVVINAAFLKLADLFYDSPGGNFLRYSIYRIFRQSRRLLSKVVNVKDLVESLSRVSDSNDSVARALCIRIMGCLADLVKDNLYIHHKIRLSLDSHHPEEASSALFAIDHLTGKSPLFSRSIMPVLDQKIEDIGTDIVYKIRMIRTFRQMHHDVELARKARLSLIKMLTQLPGSATTEAIIDSLSALALKDHIHIMDQIKLLLSTIFDDPRERIRTVALHNLQLLLLSAPYIDDSIIKSIINFMNETPTLNHCVEAQNALRNISLNNAHLLLQQDTLKSLIAFSLHSNPVHVQPAVETLVNIASHIQECPGRPQSLVFAEDFDPITYDEVPVFIGSHLWIVFASQSRLYQYEQIKERFQLLDIVCAGLVYLSRKNQAIAQKTIESSLSGIKTCSATLVCLRIKLLQVLGDMHPQVLAHNVNHLLDFLESNPPSVDVVHSVIDCILSIYRYLGPEVTQDSDRLYPIFEVICAEQGITTMYKLLTSAFTNGVYEYSAKVATNLVDKVQTPDLQLWISTLMQISQAELALQDGKLSESVVLYHQAMSYVRGCFSLEIPLEFSRKFLDLRSQFIEALTEISVYFQEFIPTPQMHKVYCETEAYSENLYSLGLEYEHLIERSFGISKRDSASVRLYSCVCFLLSLILLEFIPRSERSIKCRIPVMYIHALRDDGDSGKSIPFLQHIQSLR
eukprot:TRINITY_DN4853_c0_g1_i9.p1 TRINITY_DN4853_c0_g1~~TRINITY_DN4853_c0_g1_i9.p1  ORF type:complete len:786 (+),score=96.19 TRINITY_DN4853_c0_g1_i9:33-2390(+)